MSIMSFRSQLEDFHSLLAEIGERNQENQIKKGRFFFFLLRGPAKSVKISFIFQSFGNALDVLIKLTRSVRTEE